MHTKTLSLLLVVLCIVVAGTIPGMAGKHYGELKMVEADIVFQAPYGSCITDSTGITYVLPFGNLHIDTVYTSAYWGTYPLYLPGNVVNAYITITNTGPRAVAKHTLTTETYVINLDGSNGAALTAPQSQYIEVALGETKIIDASLTLPAGAKGLNRIAVKLYHHKNDTNDASLIMTKEGVFCPPDLQ